MERLTNRKPRISGLPGVCCTHFEGSDCQAIQGRCADGCLWEEAAWERLAAYEDTGLMPEEIIELLHQSNGPLHKKLGQWIAAEQDGRLVVSPCKVGDIVYDILDGTPYATRVVSFSYFGDRWACRTVSSYPDLAQVGTRIFLTCEEAEAALAERKECRE